MLINKLSQMSGIGILVRSIFTLSIFSGLTIPASADITTGGDGTIVNQSGNTFNITGGTPNGDGKNLFHSFGTFNLTTTPTILQVANFQPAANVQNILGRINGGLPSSIDGKIQVTGGDPKGVNLFLMNPAGIVFGKGASLDINGAFTATTAKAIDFKGKWFNAFGTNIYSELTGNPIGLAFGSGTPGSIFSAATFDASPLDPNNPARTQQTAKPGQSITLVGGTVISTGDIKTAGGNISIATVEGGKYVKINVEGSILGVLLPTALPTSANTINSAPTSFKQRSLAELLTNTKVDLAATGVKNEKGVVTLVGDPKSISDAIALGDTVSKENRSIISGDVITRDLNASSIGDRGGNIYIDSSKAILTRGLNTSSNIDPNSTTLIFKNGGDIVLNALTTIKVGEINSSTKNTPKLQPPGQTAKGGNVTLLNKRKGSDIIVGSINTSGLTSEGDKNIQGGDLTVVSAGLFRAINIDKSKNTIRTGKNGGINIDHKGSSFITGVTVVFSAARGIDIQIKSNPTFTFPDGVSGSRGLMSSFVNSAGYYGVAFTDAGFRGAAGDSVNAFSIKAPPVLPPSITEPPVPPKKDSGGRKLDTEVAKKTSGDNSEEKDPKDN